jgi:prepilin-type processing-associated H-X9-DG protein
VLSATAKPPRPALKFDVPIAPTDYEAMMGVKPSSANCHMPRPIYHAANRFSVMFRNSRTTMADIRDGSSRTIMVVECGGRPTVYRNRSANSAILNDQGIGWADSEGPFSLDGSSSDGSLEGCGAACAFAINKRNDNEPYAFHPNGASFLFADGHVRLLDADIGLTVLAALSTMNAGEIAGVTE